ncbi:hypothetical protein BDQ17DRAFT_1041530 [Cyathus striatus]|nr:hypothetical protein BDQ17DRAFT_1041530 [Cyathus striatus]
MSSFSATESTTSLISKANQQTTTKNYEAAVGALSSSYGFGGGVPTVKQKKPVAPQTNSQSNNASPSSSKDNSVNHARAPGTIPFLPSQTT